MNIVFYIPETKSAQLVDIQNAKLALKKEEFETQRQILDVQRSTLQELFDNS